MSFRTLLTILLIVYITEASDALKYGYVLPGKTGPEAVITGVRNSHDFIVSSQRGPMFRYHNGQWAVIPGSETYRGSFYLHLPEQDGRYWESKVDRNYRTVISRYDAQGAVLLLDSADVPVRHGFQYGEEQIFYGDWGRIFRFSGGELKAVENPFTGHLISHFCRGDSVWFAGRSRGVMLWNGSTFSPLPFRRFPDSEIISLSGGADGSIYALSRNGILYKTEDAQFIAVDSTYAGKQGLFMTCSPGSPDEIYIYGDPGRVYRMDGTGIDTILLPLREAVKDLAVIHPDTLLLSTRKGSIILLKPGLYPPFHNRAAEYYVDGSPDDDHHGAAFIFADDDAYPDLFVINGSGDRYSRLYINRSPEPFLDMSYGSGLQRMPEDAGFTLSDINSDGRTDILTGYPVQDGWEITAYRALGEGRYSPRRLFLTPRDSVMFLRDMAWYPSSGSAELLLAFYYSTDMTRGRILSLENRFKGLMLKKSDHFSFLPRRWYSRIIPGPISSDGVSGLYLGTYWGNDLSVSCSGDDAPAITEFNDYSNTLHFLQADLDRDGRLEIITVNNTGIPDIFRQDSIRDTGDVTDSAVLRAMLNGEGSVKFLSVLDCNNDSFIDLFICLEDHNILLLNEGGKHWKNIAADVQVEYPPLTACLIGDVDLDGQTDILGLRKGPNVLWINQGQTGTFIDLDINDRMAWSELRLYPAGMPMTDENCLGVRLAGADSGHPDYKNSPAIHFGLPDTGSYDIHIRFPGGEDRILRNIHSGSTLKVRRQSAFSVGISRLTGSILYQAVKTETYIYGTMLIIFIFLLYRSILTAMSRFSWKPLTVYIHVTTANIVFWAGLVLFYSSSPLIRYSVPLLLAGSSFALAFFFSWQHSRTLHKRSEQELMDDLLSELMVFSHGDWAMSTINGLSMLSQAVHNTGDGSPDWEEALRERRDSYRNLLSNRIDTLIRLSGSLPDMAAAREEMLLSHRQILAILSEDELRSGRELFNLLNTLKNAVREFRRMVYRRYSSDLDKVLLHIRANLHSVIGTGRLKVTLINSFSSPLMVLVPAEDLADIFDNLFQNSLRAMKNSKEPSILIRISKTGSRIITDFCDNGPGIPPEQQDSVFENGVSFSGSGGTGLFHAREILAKFGGKITLKPMQNESGCCFRLEFKEGQA